MRWEFSDTLLKNSRWIQWIRRLFASIESGAKSAGKCPMRTLAPRRIFTSRRTYSDYYQQLYASAYHRFYPYSDPYHGKTGRHALTSHKIYFSTKLGIAVLSGTWRDAPADGKIQYIPVRIPPSPPQKIALFVQNKAIFFLFSSNFSPK